MANRNDYRNIKKRRNYLPKFNITFNRLPEYLEETNEEVEALQVANTLVGRVKIKSTELVIGTPLVIGKKYRAQQDGLDDLANVGYSADSEYFIATATTPTAWVTSTIYLIEEVYDIIYNDLDSNLTIEAKTEVGGAQFTEIAIPNNLFNETKTYPQFNGVVISIVNNNTITMQISEQSSVDFDLQPYNYFKIEVYV